MFRAAYRSSSGAPTVFEASGLPAVVRLDYGRSPHAYINQEAANTVGPPDDERYAARNILSLQRTVE